MGQIGFAVFLGVLGWFILSFQLSTRPAQAFFRAQARLRFSVGVQAPDPDNSDPQNTFLSRSWEVWHTGSVPTNFWSSYWPTPVPEAEYFAPLHCHDKNTLLVSDSALENCTAEAGEKLAWQRQRDVTHFAQRDLDYQVLQPFSTLATKSGEIRITEVNWAGSFEGTTNRASDEWIELYNTTDHALSLDGLQLINGRINNGTLLFPSGYFIAPYSYFLIGKRAGVDTLLNQDPDWVASELSLSNTEAHLVLKTADGITLDETPSGQWQAGFNNTTEYKRASAQLKHRTLPGKEWSSWEHCQSESWERCSTSMKSAWKSSSQNTFGTPWHPSVL